MRRRIPSDTPIPATEIVAFCELWGRPTNVGWFWEAIEAMDDVYGKHVAEKTRQKLHSSNANPTSRPKVPIGRR